MSPHPGRRRARWAALGASLAVALAAGVVPTWSSLTASAGSAGSSSYVPITPCRLLDTRPAPDNVGSRSTPLGPLTTLTATAWGENGRCTIPAGATGLSMNIAVVNATAASFLTVFPADRARPLAANLNWEGGQAPTPNAVTAALSSSGELSFYNLAGEVDLVVDVAGYYEPSGNGPAGPTGLQGPTGPPGPFGPTGPAGEMSIVPQVIRVATSGGDFTSVSAALSSITDNGPAHPYLITVAPGTYDEPTGIAMKDHVDIEGSGRTTTVITRTVAAGNGSFFDSATVRAPSGVMAGMRGLTVRSQLATPATGVDPSTATGIAIMGTGIDISDVVVEVSGTKGDGSAFLWKSGFFIDGAVSPTLRSVDVTIEGSADVNIEVTIRKATGVTIIDLDAAPVRSTTGTARRLDPVPMTAPTRSRCGTR